MMTGDAQGSSSIFSHSGVAMPIPVMQTGLENRPSDVSPF